MSNGWVRCTKRHPCPICGKPDWCVYTADGSVVLCMRKENAHPSRGQAGGWVYRMKEEPEPGRNRRREKHEDGHMTQKSAKSLLQTWQRVTTRARIKEFAGGLGVDPAALKKLGAVWCEGQLCWAFPMRDETGEPIGIRLRSKTRKFSVPGSRTGLFFDPGAKPKAGGCAWLTEGPTDTAAVMSLGVPLVVGRSDLLSAWRMLKARLSLVGAVAVNICVDDESEKEGRLDAPGRSGSLRLAKAMGLPCRFVRVPGCKDIRDYVKQGGTLEELEKMLAYQPFGGVL